MNIEVNEVITPYILTIRMLNQEIEKCLKEIERLKAENEKLKENK